MAQSAFGVSVPETVMQEAIEYFSFEKQKEREWKFAADERVECGAASVGASLKCWFGKVKRGGECAD